MKAEWFVSKVAGPRLAGALAVSYLLSQRAPLSSTVRVALVAEAARPVQTPPVKVGGGAQFEEVVRTAVANCWGCTQKRFKQLMLKEC